MAEGISVFFPAYNDEGSIAGLVGRRWAVPLAVICVGAGVAFLLLRRRRRRARPPADDSVKLDTH